MYTLARDSYLCWWQCTPWTLCHTTSLKYSFNLLTYCISLELGSGRAVKKSLTGFVPMVWCSESGCLPWSMRTLLGWAQAFQTEGIHFLFSWEVFQGLWVWRCLATSNRSSPSGWDPDWLPWYGMFHYHSSKQQMACGICLLLGQTRVLWEQTYHNLRTGAVSKNILICGRFRGGVLYVEHPQHWESEPSFFSTLITLFLRSFSSWTIQVSQLKQNLNSCSLVSALYSSLFLISKLDP